MKNTKVQKMVGVALFASMGMVLQLFGFWILPGFNFLKVDFSDIPVMLGMFLYGPMAGIATALLRSTLHLLITGFEPSNLVGDVASFFATTIFTLPMYYFFKGTTAKRNKILGVVSGIVAMTIFMSIANYYVITPLYLKFFGTTATQMLGMSMGRYISVGIIPFNLIKGAIVSGVFLILHAKLLPWLSRKQRHVEQTNGI